MSTFGLSPVIQSKFCIFGIDNISSVTSYFGEIFLWWGIWILCLSPSTNGPVEGGGLAAQWASIVGPIFITALLFGISGLPLQEPQTQKKMHESDKKDDYAKYLHRTSIVLPLPPMLYRPLPLWMKRSILLDFPFYQYDPAKDSSKDDDQERGESRTSRESSQQLNQESQH